MTFPQYTTTVDHDRFTDIDIHIMCILRLGPIGPY